MAVAKRKKQEKPKKIEQWKAQGLEWGPQVKQTTLLASPIYLRRLRGGEETYNNKRQN